MILNNNNFFRTENNDMAEVYKDEFWTREDFESQFKIPYSGNNKEEAVNALYNELSESTREEMMNRFRQAAEEKYDNVDEFLEDNYIMKEDFLDAAKELEVNLDDLFIAAGCKSYEQICYPFVENEQYKEWTGKDLSESTPEEIAAYKEYMIDTTMKLLQKVQEFHSYLCHNPGTVHLALQLQEYCHHKHLHSKHSIS